MNNFVFKIFGAPYTFDLYRGNGSEIGYFQNFDNGGKENTKLTIHRMASGRVSYSYLRYNFISSSGRPNSFFGMSVVFDNEYCKDIQKIFDLFDAIYKGVILKNGILLTELKGNPTAQAKYIVRNFAEAEGEVKNVENNIINNLKNHFADDILPLDNSFLESNSMVKLNDKMGNAAFINALRKCSWVNISSAYSTNEEPIPNPEFLATLDDAIEDVQKQIPTVSVRALKKENVQRDVYALLKGIQDALAKIDVWLEKEYKLPKGTHLNPYLQKQPDLKERSEKLLEIQKPLNDLCDVVETTTPTLQQPSTSGTTTNNGTQNGTQGDELPQNPVLIFWKKHKPQIIAIAIVIAIILLSILILKPNDKPPVDTGTIPSQETPVLTPVEIPIETTVDSLQYWWDKALAAVNEKKYQDAIKYLDEAAKYNNDRYDVDACKKEVQKKIDNGTAVNSNNTNGKDNSNTGNINITVTDVNNKLLSDNVVTYNGNTAAFRVKVSSNIGSGSWSCEDTTVRIINSEHADTKVEIDNPDDNKSYTLTFAVGNKSNSVTVTTQKMSGRQTSSF